MLGLNLPPLEAVLGVGAGFIVPPFVTGMVMGFVPDWMKTNRWAFLAVKGVSAFVPPMLIRQFVGRRIGNYMLVGGGVYFAMELIKEFAPGVIPGLGAQPLLGSYFDRPVNSTPFPRVRAGLPPILQAVPDRLSPDTRF